jgi:hypothetical protein
MTDLNWCTYCDNAIAQSSVSCRILRNGNNSTNRNIYKDALYCSEKCLRLDTLHFLNSNHQFNSIPHCNTKSSSKNIQFMTTQQLPHSYAISDLTNTSTSTTSTTSCRLYHARTNTVTTRRSSKLN